ncbi:hypothetical protein CA267_016535 [Alteromonas pelagimontana]|uniref:Uncharacterized protein n=1 Tax=Alteromonas pelagimontana TaxID=1858656 RepID=A0A6M4MGQ3_9ALTE|nr:hypothetical protein [Alteromonas pelagimontana]QJR82242.1 hypothetical protein CA267_016535 [Alteromonas pelagimontana]
MEMNVSREDMKMIIMELIDGAELIGIRESANQIYCKLCGATAPHTENAEVEHFDHCAVSRSDMCLGYKFRGFQKED